MFMKRLQKKQSVGLDLFRSYVSSHPLTAARRVDWNIAQSSTMQIMRCSGIYPLRTTPLGEQTAAMIAPDFSNRKPQFIAVFFLVLNFHVLWVDYTHEINYFPFDPVSHTDPLSLFGDAFVFLYGSRAKSPRCIRDDGNCTLSHVSIVHYDHTLYLQACILPWSSISDNDADLSTTGISLRMWTHRNRGIQSTRDTRMANRRTLILHTLPLRAHDPKSERKRLKNPRHARIR